MIELDGYTYAMYEARQERATRHRPKCDLCEYPITGDEAYEIEGKLYCPDCIENSKTYISTEEW